MSKSEFTILFSCIGRRVALVNAFRESLQRLGLKGRILGSDMMPYSAALQVCDEAHVVHSSTHEAYVDQLLGLCRDNGVDLLIPLIDPELHILAGLNDRFREVGTTLCLSSKEVVRVCRDKVRTHDFLTKVGIDTPALFACDQVRDSDLPLFMKPRDGSSAKDIHRISTRRQLEFYQQDVHGAIIQEFLPGQEFTLDIFCDFSGEPRCAVPRKRIEVRGGEVVKSMTVKDSEIIEVGMATARALGGCMGPITLQCFRTDSGRISVIEINPRLGGGVPLSIAAGADIPGWIIQCTRGESPPIDPLAFRDRLVMLRYDEAVYVHEDQLPK
ncbi:MAG: ATP-grasp domain-containing protein [Planctomycetes bacterium]|nr:ATP-grasp domain-containing protein [Planctomycetota bacterium]